MFAVRMSYFEYPLSHNGSPSQNSLYIRTLKAFAKGRGRHDFDTVHQRIDVLRETGSCA